MVANPGGGGEKETCPSTSISDAGPASALCSAAALGTCSAAHKRRAPGRLQLERKRVCGILGHPGFSHILSSWTLFTFWVWTILVANKKLAYPFWTIHSGSWFWVGLKENPKENNLLVLTPSLFVRTYRLIEGDSGPGFGQVVKLGSL